MLQWYRAVFSVLKCVWPTWNGFRFRLSSRSRFRSRSRSRFRSRFRFRFRIGFRFRFTFRLNPEPSCVSAELIVCPGNAGDIEGALAKLPRYLTAERAVLEVISSKQDSSKRLDPLPVCLCCSDFWVLSCSIPLPLPPPPLPLHPCPCFSAHLEPFLLRIVTTQQLSKFFAALVGIRLEISSAAVSQHSGAGRGQDVQRTRGRGEEGGGEG